MELGLSRTAQDAAVAGVGVEIARQEVRYS